MEKIKFLHRVLKYAYIYDAAEIAFIRKTLNKGDVAVDVGCHKGGYLYWIRKAVGKKGKVYAFEPQAPLFAYLEKLVSRFGYENVVLEEKGVTNEDGVHDFYIPITEKGSDPGAKLDLKNRFWHEWESTQVEVVSLDSYFLSRGIIPQLIKIDVEGHEKTVVEGGRELIKKHHPDLLIEIEQQHLVDVPIQDVFEYVMGLGYQGYFFDRGKKLPVRQFDPEYHQDLSANKSVGGKKYINNFVFEAS